MSRKFQSTLSMRRATFVCTVGGISLIISIHALHEESDHTRRITGIKADISIHALHEESDFTSLLKNLRLSGFQSTLSMRRATFSPFTRNS